MTRFPPPTAPSPAEELKNARREVHPPAGARERVRRNILQRIEQPLFTDVRESLTPHPSMAWRLWSSVRQSLPAPSLSLWEGLCESLSPPAVLRDLLRGRILGRLAPVPVRAFLPRPLVWIATLCLVALLARAAPLLFLAPRSVARSPVLILSQGEVYISSGVGLAQPAAAETILEQSALIQTGEGTATVVLGDRGVLRLKENTTVALHDISPRPSTRQYEPTLTLHGGSIWMQGLSSHILPGMTVAFSEGKVRVHEGSVSIAEGVVPRIAVWDRRAAVIRDDASLVLVAGEAADVRKGTAMLVRKIAPAQYDDAWVSGNLRKDATRRREIAQLWQERRAAAAGILPTSTLYSVKRVAEEVDVLLTLSEKGKAQKRLDQAQTRLNEAAALLQEGSPEATIPLEQYRETVLAVATATGSNKAVQALIQEELAQTVADVSAVLPDDDGYLLKETVLRASADVPDAVVREEDVQHTLLSDQVAALKLHLDEAEDPSEVLSDYERVKATLQWASEGLSPQVLREVEASLAPLAAALGEGEQPAGQNTEIPRLTREEIAVLVESIRYRVMDVLTQEASRLNQLQAELRFLDAHPDRGNILRQLRRAFQQEPELRLLVDHRLRHGGGSDRGVDSSF